MFINILSIAIAAFVERRSRGEILEDDYPERAVIFPSLSVIIPARNEEHNIKDCIESVLDVDYPDFEIIVVDDESVDRTGSIVEAIRQKDSRIRYIRSKRQEGWVGKNYALYIGSLNARGEWLLFIDADVRLFRSSLKRAVGYLLEKKLDMLSISGIQETSTVWEVMIQPVIYHMLNIRYPLYLVNRHPSLSAASGQFILISRKVYNDLGGHQAIREEILEDVRLAEMIKKSGFRMKFLHSSKILKVRMYSNFYEIFKGWTKNLYFLAGNKRWMLIWLSYTLVTWVVLPVLSWYVIVNRFWEKELITASSIVYIILTNLFSLNLWLNFPKGIFISFLYPLSFFLVFIIMAASWWRSRILNIVEWKGRVYRINKVKR